MIYNSQDERFNQCRLKGNLLQSSHNAMPAETENNKVKDIM
jgi:hypothetical protein